MRQIYIRGTHFSWSSIDSRVKVVMSYWVTLCIFLLPLSFAKEEFRMSEYIPRDVDELHRVSVAMNCLVDNFSNSTSIQECLSCFFPFNMPSLQCYKKFFTGSKSEKCFLPIISEITEENRENILFNVTSCVDFNLRVKTINFCVEKLSVNQYQERDVIVNSLGACFETNINLLFNEAINALEASSVGSFDPIRKDILDQTYHIEIISKCEEISEDTLKECKSCFNDVLNNKDSDVPTIFNESLICSNEFLNPVFGKCFNSENFSGKTFTTAYEAKRAMGSCLHDNTDNILQDICTYNLPGQYVSSPRPQEIFSLASACMEYHHIKLHNAHFNKDLLESLRLHDDYVLAVNGISEEVKTFFDNIVITQVKHHD